MPLLFACLKIDLHLSRLSSGSALTSLDSFLQFDEGHKLLQAHSFHTVLLIARIYTADSLKYKS
jgi:hypothetical protein